MFKSAKCTREYRSRGVLPTQGVSTEEDACRLAETRGLRPVYVVRAGEERSEIVGNWRAESVQKHACKPLSVVLAACLFADGFKLRSTKKVKASIRLAIIIEFEEYCTVFKLDRVNHYII
jgi:hypothetical protein